MKNVTRSMVGLMVVISVLLSGCGGGNLASVQTSLKKGEVNKQRIILVKDFDITNALFTGDNAADPSVVKMQKAKIAYDAKMSLISRLTKDGFKADDFKTLNHADNAVVVESTVARVNHGSGATRFWVGCGAGAAWMEAAVKIYAVEDMNNVLAEFQVQSSSQGLASPSDMTDLLVRELAATIADYIKRNS